MSTWRQYDKLHPVRCSGRPLSFHPGFRSSSRGSLKRPAGLSHGANRLTNIASFGGTSSASPTLASFGYAYNAAGQRTEITVAAGSYASPGSWRFQYDPLGQVTSGKKYWADGTIVPGQQFEYTFDEIGNRKQTRAGGDAIGYGLRSAAYTNNLVNQITGREVPGTNDILGLAHASATVTVNGQSVYRRGEYFWKEFGVTNASGVAWHPVTNQATLAGSTNTQVGSLLTPRRGQVFWHDLDGNLLSDGVWTNTWDAENRVIATESAPGAPTAAKAKETWSYYADGRWKERVIYAWTNTQYQAVSTNRFVWDGNVIVAIVDQASVLVQGFMRGLDLSGTPQAAGGTGGLLALVTPSNGSHFYCFDGNGNVAALISATNGTETARYEYGPFGELLRATGPMARENALRFSSQFTDDITGRIKYLYREYEAWTGRWTSRDPLLDHSFFRSNQHSDSRIRRDFGSRTECYVFAENAPTKNTDTLGLISGVYIEPRYCGEKVNWIDTALQSALGTLQDLSETPDLPEEWALVTECLLGRGGSELSIKCERPRCGTGRCKNTLGYHGLGWITICNSAYRDFKTLQRTVIVEAAKLHCGLTAATEYKFNTWLETVLSELWPEPADEPQPLGNEGATLNEFLR